MADVVHLLTPYRGETRVRFQARLALWRARKGWRDPTQPVRTVVLPPLQIAFDFPDQAPPRGEETA